MSTAARAEAEQNIATVRRVFDEVINQKKLETIDEIYDANIVDHDPLPGAPPGIEGVKFSIGGLIDGFPDLHVEIEDISGFRNFVAVHNTWQGTQTGRLLGLPPSGRSLTFTGVVIWRLDGGKIAERWALVDFVQQLGVASRRRRGRPTSLDFEGSITPHVSLQPIKPEKFEAWEEFNRELAGARRAEFAASRHRLGVKREVIYLVIWPREGDLQHQIGYYEVEDLVRFGVGLAISEDPFDIWFRERVADLHGFDWDAVAELGPSSRMVFEWAAD
jgi:predicted ester cyclase